MEMGICEAPVEGLNLQIQRLTRFYGEGEAAFLVLRNAGSREQIAVYVVYRDLEGLFRIAVQVQFAVRAGVDGVPAAGDVAASGIQDRSICWTERAMNVLKTVFAFIKSADIDCHDYIVGHTDIRRKIEPAEAYHLNRRESELVTRFRALNDREKNCIELVVDNFLTK